MYYAPGISVQTLFHSPNYTIGWMCKTLSKNSIVREVLVILSKTKYKCNILW